MIDVVSRDSCRRLATLMRLANASDHAMPSSLLATRLPFMMPIHRYFSIQKREKRWTSTPQPKTLNRREIQVIIRAHMQAVPKYMQRWRNVMFTTLIRTRSNAGSVTLSCLTHTSLIYICKKSMTAFLLLQHREDGHLINVWNQAALLNFVTKNHDNHT